MNWGSEEQFTGQLSAPQVSTQEWFTNKAHPYQVRLEIPANAERAGLVFGGTRIPLDLAGDPILDLTNHIPTPLAPAPCDRGAPTWTQGYWLAGEHGLAVQAVSRQLLAQAPSWVQVKIDLAVASLGGQSEQAAPLTLSPGAGDLCFGPPEGADCLRVLWGHIFQFDAELSSREGTGTRPWPTSRHWPVRASFQAPTNATTAMLQFGENIVPLDLRGSTGQVPLWDYLEHYQE